MNHRGLIQDTQHEFWQIWTLMWGKAVNRKQPQFIGRLTLGNLQDNELLSAHVSLLIKAGEASLRAPSKGSAFQLVSFWLDLHRF